MTNREADGREAARYWSLPAELRSFVAVAGLLLFPVLLAFAGYLLWLRWSGELAGSFQQQVPVLVGAAEQLKTILLIGFPLGVVIWAVYRRRGRRETGWQLWWARVGASSIFFAATLAIWLLWFPASESHWPIWALAWILSPITFAIATAAERLRPRARQYISYRPVQTLIDAGVIGGSLILAYLIRFDGRPPERYEQQMWLVVSSVVLFYLVVLHAWGSARFIWRFVGLREGLVMLQAVATASLIVLLLRLTVFYPYPGLRIPLGVVVVHPMLVYVGLMGVRVARRLQYRAQKRRERPHPFEPVQQRRVLLIGAGHAGQLLLRDLLNDQRFKPVGFLDDDPRKNGRVINGVRVWGACGRLAEVHEQLGFEEVILSMPSAPPHRIQEVVAACEELGLRVSTVPSLSEIVLGRVRISHLREVHMEDLLGRATIEWDKSDEFLVNTYRGKSILITGAAGSIGSELVRQLKQLTPAALILLDRDENGLFEIALETREDYAGKVREVIADIRDSARMKSVFKDLRPEVVFHAAAFKHVPLMEMHPCEAILNNVLGSRNLIETADRFGVAHFVLISTDKAVNPTNVMGATKRLAEMIMQEKARRSATRFCAVRFGNVLGSRASVVPVFLRQINSGRNITVTHPDVRRYFMTIPEAVQLVIKAGSLGRKGEIFVLDMGDPVKIVDLARNLIELAGLAPGRDVEIEFTGLRPGEKLHEELLTDEENGARETTYPKIFAARTIHGDWTGLNTDVEQLIEAARADDSAKIRAVLHRLQIGYSSVDKALERA